MNLAIIRNILTELGERRTACKHKFFHTYTLDPWGRVKRSNFFSECGHVAYQIKGTEVLTQTEAKRLTLHTSLISGSD